MARKYRLLAWWVGRVQRMARRRDEPGAERILAALEDLHNVLLDRPRVDRHPEATE